MDLAETLDGVATGVEVVGITTIVIGLGLTLVRAVLALSRGQGGEGTYRIIRTVFGRSVCSAWSSWSRPTSSGPWASSHPFATSLCSG